MRTIIQAKTHLTRPHTLDSARRPLVCLLLALLLCSTIALVAGTDSNGQTDLSSRSATLLQDATPPVADAGSNRSVYVGAIVTFNGSGSTDDIAVTNYTWTIYEGVEEVVLYGMTVTHIFSEAGVFEVSLNVSDSEPNWDADSVWVTVSEDTEPPVAASVNPERSITTGTRIVLSANKSTDNARIVNYSWSFNYDDEDLELYGKWLPFWFNRSGTYEINLTVTDASGLTNSTTITVEVSNAKTWLGRNWLALTITALIVIVAARAVIRKLKKDKTLLTSSDIEKLNLQWKSLMKTWQIFRSNRIGMTGFVAIVVFVIVAIAAPALSTVKDPNLTDNYEPTIIVEDPETGNDTVVQMNPLPPSLSPSEFTGFLHPLGTDHKGEDIYSMTLYGARASLYVGLVATAISALMGAIIGLTAGYFGKVADEVLMRATDFFLVLPWFPLMIVMMAILGRDFVWIIVVIGITSWPSTARIVRSQVLTIKERQFIERARAIGAGDGHIISKHIMPNVMPLIFANTVLLISLAIFSESFLDFFGLGDPRVISWGTMLEGAYQYGAFYRGAWWYILPPGLCILAMVLSFSLIGYALDDVLNPKLRRR